MKTSPLLTHDPSSYALPGFPPSRIWEWKQWKVAYQTMGTTGPAVILVHGFGASWGHWRKNIPVLAQHCRVYAIDLLGFGASQKPDPATEVGYTFETWGSQIVDFCREVVGSSAVFVGNSIGCVAAMQAAVMAPDLVESVVLLNCSLRLLHDRRREQLPWFRRMGAPILQKILENRWIGQLFFKAIATPKTVRKILLQAYAQPDAVTDELVQFLLHPAFEAGAVDVFLAFTRYSQGPLPEDLLAVLTCPVLMLWGEEDPWEPIDLGRSLATFDCVQEFVAIPNAGHCPQDEVPEFVNARLLDWIVQK
jgi:pimeloyl-ACP methyl ester carboxylesterase